MSDILHNGFCSACGYNNVMRDPDHDWGEPVYIETKPEPEPESKHPLAKDFEVWGKIGLSVVCVYLFFKYIVNDGKK